MDIPMRIRYGGSVETEVRREETPPLPTPQLSRQQGISNPLTLTHQHRPCAPTPITAADRQQQQHRGYSLHAYTPACRPDRPSTTSRVTPLQL